MNRGLKEKAKIISLNIGEKVGTYININENDANLHFGVNLNTYSDDFPLDLSLIYALSEKESSSFFGKGFKLNLYKKIENLIDCFSVTNAISSAIIGGIIGGITDGWSGLLDGASSGFMWGAISGAIIGGATSGINIASGGVEIIGSAQKTGNLLHRFSSNIQAGKFAMQIGRYSEVGLNSSLNKTGMVGRMRPDVTVVARFGKNKLIEIVSSSQTILSQQNKIAHMLSLNPNTTGRVVGRAFQHRFYF